MILEEVDTVIGLEFVLQERKIKKKDFAELLNVHQVQVTNWITGERPMPQQHLTKASKLLNVSEEFLKQNIKVQYIFDVEEVLDIKKDKNKNSEWDELIELLRKNDISSQKAIDIFNVYLKMKSI